MIPFGTGTGLEGGVGAVKVPKHKTCSCYFQCDSTEMKGTSWGRCNGKTVHVAQARGVRGVHPPVNPTTH